MGKVTLLVISISLVLLAGCGKKNNPTPQNSSKGISASQVIGVWDVASLQLQTDPNNAKTVTSVVLDTYYNNFLPYTSIQFRSDGTIGVLGKNGTYQDIGNWSLNTAGTIITIKPTEEESEDWTIVLNAGGSASLYRKFASTFTFTDDSTSPNGSAPLITYGMYMTFNHRANT